MLDQQDNHGQNNQVSLDFLNLAAAQIRTLLAHTGGRLPEKQPRIRRTSINTPKQRAGAQTPAHELSSDS